MHNTSYLEKEAYMSITGIESPLENCWYLRIGTALSQRCISTVPNERTSDRTEIIYISQTPCLYYLIQTYTKAQDRNLVSGVHPILGRQAQVGHDGRCAVANVFNDRRY